MTLLRMLNSKLTKDISIKRSILNNKYDEYSYGSIEIIKGLLRDRKSIQRKDDIDYIKTDYSLITLIELSENDLVIHNNKEWIIREKKPQRDKDTLENIFYIYYF